MHLRQVNKIEQYQHRYTTINFSGLYNEFLQNRTEQKFYFRLKHTSSSSLHHIHIYIVTRLGREHKHNMNK